MIKNFLQVKSEKDVENAIALFLNRDIEKAEFNGFTYTIKSEQIGEKFLDVLIDVIVSDTRIKKNIYIARMPYKTYDLVIRGEVQEKLSQYALEKECKKYRE